MNEKEIASKLGIDTFLGDGAGADQDIFNEDVELLRTALVNEKLAPELLPYEEDLITDIKAQIDNQQGIVDDSGNDTEEMFRASLYQMEVDRLKYTLSSYLRTRLRKIENHTLYILKSAQSYNRLSTQEFSFAQNYLNLLQDHMSKSVLDQLPESLRTITEQTEQCNMIETPNMDRFVFCRAVKDIGDVQMDDTGDLVASMAQGDIFAVRYRPISGHIMEGTLELL